MRAKQSSTANDIHSRSEAFTAIQPICADPGNVRFDVDIPAFSRAKASRSEGVAHGKGLAHDARNMMGALGLYSDLLALPGVLKPEHRHYADELRLLSTRSYSLMERLMLTLPEAHADAVRAMPHNLRSTPLHRREDAAPLSLRAVLEHCSGLLSRVAGGRTVELAYGPAASMPVLALQEDVERILINLVRNAAAALDRREDGNRPAPAAADRRPRSAGGALGTVKQMRQDGRSDENREAVRIGLGLLQNVAGESGPWPFLRLRLTVEDSGCGMNAGQLQRLLRGNETGSQSSRGIGFQVVQELAAASGAAVRVNSALGVGTHVQLEWPIAMLDAVAPDGEGLGGDCDPPNDLARASRGQGRHRPAREPGAAEASSPPHASGPSGPSPSSDAAAGSGRSAGRSARRSAQTVQSLPPGRPVRPPSVSGSQSASGRWTI